MLLFTFSSLFMVGMTLKGYCLNTFGITDIIAGLVMALLVYSAGLVTGWTIRKIGADMGAKRYPYSRKQKIIYTVIAIGIGFGLL